MLLTLFNIFSNLNFFSDWQNIKRTLATPYWNSWLTYNCNITEGLGPSCTRPRAAGDWESRQENMGQVSTRSIFPNIFYLIFVHLYLRLTQSKYPSCTDLKE